MCSSHQHHDSQTPSHAAADGALTFKVDDMTCGHCAGTIKKAIESVVDGAEVSADPASKLVSVRGATNFPQLREIVTAAGYTPSEALVQS